MLDGSFTARPTAVTRPQGLTLGSGTMAALAVTTFRASAEQNRTRQRMSEVSLPRSLYNRASSARSVHTTGASSPTKGGPPAIATKAASSSAAPSPEKSDLVQTIINASPGAYAGDDGSEDVADRYNFYAHGRRFLFATNSLGLFDETSAFRRRIIWLITSRAFDQLVLALIFANSIILALPDLAHVTDDGELDSTNSLRNAIVAYADGLFTTLFSIECTLKIIAMGLVSERGAYLMDPWNWIDFVVVSVGIIAAIPGIPSVSGLRAFRVLRPLRFLNAVPGIKKLVTALLQSIPELLSVVAFLFFLFFLYGVIGVQLWSGVLHARCRLTPFPLALDPALTWDEFPAYEQRALANPELFRCRDDSNDSAALPLDNPLWTHDSSPWRRPRVCYWPVAVEVDVRPCNVDGATFRQCPHPQTCGSDYDNYGNFRFTHPDTTIARRLLTSSTYDPNFNYGVTSFDNIGSAALIIFTIMPREGWSDIMYMVQDAGYGTAATIYFLSFVLIGSYFMLNLALAVIWENFSEQSFLEAEEVRNEKELELAAQRHAMKKRKSNIRGLPGVAIFRRIIEHWAFNILRTLLILLNTVILSLDQYPIDASLTRVVDILNGGLTIAFSIEVILKFFGLGRRLWAKDGYNIYDAIVSILSILELCLAPPEFLGGVLSTSTTSAFSGLRSMRIFSLFKLAQYWPSLQKLLETIISTIREIGNFSVLLLLFMYIYALIGMQVFGNRFRFDEEGYPVDRKNSEASVPRANFDTILWSMVTIFQILTGENWTDVMISGWRSVGWPCVIYFVSLVILGNFILLNLFLAILLGNFEDSEEEFDQLAIEKEELRKRSRVTPMRSSTSELSRRERKSVQGATNRPSTSRRGSANASAQGATARRNSQALARFGNAARKVSATLPTNNPVPMTMSAVALAAMNQKNNKTVLQTTTTSQPQRPTGRALNIFGPRNWIRKNTWLIVHHPLFDKILLVLVVASSVSVGLDNPLTAPDSTQVLILRWADMLLTGLFLFEVVLKIIAQGLYFDSNAYLKNNWNVMDFVITLVSVFGLQASTTHLELLKTLRTFRALRPLRLINRNAGMKLVVSSLFAAIPQIVNVLTVCLLLLTIFSILAVNNLKGKLYSCQGDAFDALSPAQQRLVTYPRPWAELTSTEQQWFNQETALIYENATSSITSRVVCGFFGAKWMRTIPQSFDNVLYGLRTFFEISTTEGWVRIMLASVDATDIDMQPIPNHREGWTIFFIAFIFMGSFFIIQLFIGVVIENFNKMKEKLDGTFLLSAPQREWLMISEAIWNIRPHRKHKTPRQPIRRLCYDIVHNPALETLTMGCIILNTFIMALSYFGEEDLYRHAIDYSNYFFGIIFTIEAAIKIVGLGRYYWKDSWNVFDFTIVVGSFLGMLYTWVGGSAIGTSASIIRSVRVARLVKLIQTWPSLHQLVNTLLITIPSLVSIGGLLFLVLFIYAALGVQMFAKVKMGTLINEQVNFQSLTRAMITLIRCSTGERWNDMMHELSSTKNCTPDPTYNALMCGFHTFDGCMPLTGCGTNFAFVYFCTFTMLVTFVLLNIFIAVILEGFANEKDRSAGVLLPEHYENFISTWAVFDPEATGYLGWHDLPNFLQQLDEPLGFGDNYHASRKEMQAFIQHLDFTVYNGNKVFFSDVARKLGKFVLDVVNGSSVEDLPSNIEIDQKWRALLRGSKVRKMERSTHRVNHFHAAILIHEAVKSAVFREELKARVHKFTELTKTIIDPSASDLLIRSPRTQRVGTSPSRKGSAGGVRGERSSRSNRSGRSGRSGRERREGVPGAAEVDDDFLFFG